MNNRSFSIKQKFTLALLATVLISTTLVGVLSQIQSRDLLTEQIETEVLPNMLQRIGNSIDKEISVLENATRQMVELPFIEKWMQAGHPAEDESQIVAMLQRVQQQYDLTNASVVNRETAHYWNQDGFLRVLQDDAADGWFFAYRASGQTVAKSLYSEDDVPKLFINYQDTDGIVAAGIGRSVSEFVALLERNRIRENGFVYLVDADGLIKLHKDTSLLDKASVTSLYGSEAGASLTRQKPFALEKIDVRGEAHYLASSYIPSANWYVVAEVPVAEMFAELDSALWTMLLEIIAVTVMAGLIAAWLAGRLTHPIAELADTFSRLGASEANLNVQLKTQKETELRALQDGFNEFLAKIKLTVSDISQASHQLKGVTDKVSSESVAVLKMGETQASHTQEVTDAVEHLNSSVRLIAENANRAADTATELHAISSEGRQISSQAKAAMTDLNQHTSAVSESISNLAKHAESIEDVLNVIKGVSEQTNLLALNAAIEAARAGEQGRGFAVVADEVRSLAQRTHESTDEIGATIQRLQSEVSKAVHLMQQSQQKSEEGDAAVSQNEQALDKIASSIAGVTQVSMQVADTTKEQAKVTQDIMQSLQAIKQETDALLASSGQVSASTAALRQLTQRLDSLVSQYES